ncbi:MAG: prepilin peptidase [Kiloniellaceae bacterium]
MSASALVSTATLLTFVVLVFSAAVSDIRSFTVPNRVCLAVVLLYPAFVASATHPVAWAPALAVAAAALLLGFLLFAVGAWGGGDAKLFAAAALWAGPEFIIPLTVFTTLAGGVMAIFIWLQHRLSRAPVAAMMLHVEADPDVGKQPMPYGAAIAVGALYVAFTLLKVN